MNLLKNILIRMHKAIDNVKLLFITKGFTLIELVVVLVIISILSLMGVTTYRNSVKKAMASEGLALVAAVAKTEKIYFATHGSYLRVGNTNRNTELCIDCSNNTYFRTFRVIVPVFFGNYFEVRTDGTGNAQGMRIVYKSDPDGNRIVDTPPEITVGVPGCAVPI